MKKISRFLWLYAGIPFLASIPALVANLFYPQPVIDLVCVPVLVAFIYVFYNRKKDLKSVAAEVRLNGYALLILTMIFTIMMVLSKGNLDSLLMMNFNWFIFPLAPLQFFATLMGAPEVVYLTAFLTYLVACLVCTMKMKKASRFIRRQIPFILACCFICLAINTFLYSKRPAVKYGGHGFQYMNGYSSTDFTDYTVYAKNSKLVTLDHEPSLLIEKEQDMPILDGAEACYPLYAAFAKAVYKDIDQIEMNCDQDTLRLQNGKIVTFTNTIRGIDRLIMGGAYRDNTADVNEETAVEDIIYKNGIDMFFGARPSKDQYRMAQEYGVDLEVTPIGREAFVFFVEEDNPVDGLSSEQIQNIYHGDVENWADLGGKNQKIRAFQRPEGSGSQTMMNYFMGDIPLKKPETYEVVSAMEGVISEVAQYANEEGAMGYTFRYFLEELNQEEGIKMLSIDGIYPTLETIEDGTYPLTVDLCLITRKNDPNPNVQKMKEFILSKDGQTIIHNTGYGMSQKGTGTK